MALQEIRVPVFYRLTMVSPMFSEIQVGMGQNPGA